MAAAVSWFSATPTCSTVPAFARRTMSATGPLYSSSPCSMMPMVLHRSASSGRMCDEIRIVLPIRWSSLSSARFAPGGLEKRGENFDGSGFSGAVRADEPEAIALVDLEVQVRQRDEGAVALRQVYGFDHYGHGGVPGCDCRDAAIQVNALTPA